MMSGLISATALAFVVSVLATAIIRMIARRYDLVVAPRPDRWHETPTALYGGVAIALALLLTVLLLSSGDLLGDIEAAAILTAATVLFAVGVFDDRYGLGPVGKFILQAGAGTVLVFAGVVLPTTPWSPVNIVVTLFWYIGIVNALNLLDNMDGAAAGVCMVAAAGFAALYVAAGAHLLATLALSTAGAAAGFLVFNFKPASIFMGDGGSLFLGGMLGGLGAAYPVAGDAPRIAGLLIPALLLIVPVLDTALVIVSRTLNNRRISVGGRDHSTHRLVAMGFTEARAAVTLYGIGAAAIGVALVMRSASPAAGVCLGTAFMAGALLFAGYLGRLHCYDDGTRERRRRGVIVRNILLKRRGLQLMLDVVLFGVAYYAAFIIYYEGAIPLEMATGATTTLGIVIVLKLAAFHYFQVYRGTWARTGLADVHRIGKAAVFSTILVVAVLFLVARGGAIPRTVFVLDFLLTAALAMIARSSFRSLDRLRRRLRSDSGSPALICGAGPEADLILDALQARPEYERYRVVGFLDDREPVGTLIHGLPVLGHLRDASRVLQEVRPAHLIMASLATQEESVGDFPAICSRYGVELLTMSFSLRAVAGPQRRSSEPRPDSQRVPGDLPHLAASRAV